MLCSVANESNFISLTPNNVIGLEDNQVMISSDNLVLYSQHNNAKVTITKNFSGIEDLWIMHGRITSIAIY